MAHLRYDAEGKEVYFQHAVDAREGVERGFFFETNPIKDAEKRASLQKEAKPEVVVEKKQKKIDAEPEVPVMTDEIPDEEK